MSVEVFFSWFSFFLFVIKRKGGLGILQMKKFTEVYRLSYLLPKHCHLYHLQRLSISANTLNYKIGFTLHFFSIFMIWTYYIFCLFSENDAHKFLKDFKKPKRSIYTDHPDQDNATEECCYERCDLNEVIEYCH